MLFGSWCVLVCGTSMGTRYVNLPVIEYVGVGLAGLMFRFTLRFSTLFRDGFAHYTLFITCTLIVCNHDDFPVSKNTREFNIMI